jgi:hypothetical protein
MGDEKRPYRPPVEIAPVEAAVRELLRRAYRHEANESRLTTEEFDLLADIHDWWQAERTGRLRDNAGSVAPEPTR